MDLLHLQRKSGLVQAEVRDQSANLLGGTKEELHLDRLKSYICFPIGCLTP